MSLFYIRIEGMHFGMSDSVKIFQHPVIEHTFQECHLLLYLENILKLLQIYKYI